MDTAETDLTVSICFPLNPITHIRCGFYTGNTKTTHETTKALIKEGLKLISVNHKTYHQDVCVCARIGLEQFLFLSLLLTHTHIYIHLHTCTTTFLRTLTDMMHLPRSNPNPILILILKKQSEDIRTSQNIHALCFSKSNKYKYMYKHTHLF